MEAGLSQWRFSLVSGRLTASSLPCALQALAVAPRECARVAMNFPPIRKGAGNAGCALHPGASWSAFLSSWSHVGRSGIASRPSRGETARVIALISVSGDW